MRTRTGFTLIDLVIAIAVIAILATIALPAYSNYIRRAKIHDAFNFLVALRAKQELYWIDAHDYGPSACAIGALPGSSQYFSYTCDINNSQQGYLITAKGQGDLLNYNFTIDQSGRRITIDFPGISALPVSCWMDGPGHCM